MPKLRSRERWEHPNYKYAYVINRNGICYTIINGGEKKSIKFLEFKKENKKNALSILHQRLLETLKNQGTIKTIFIKDAIEEFKLIHFKNISLINQKIYLIAFKIFTKDIELKEIAKIRLIINQFYDSSKYTDSTKKTYISRLSKFFKYCIDSEYITKNPITSNMTKQVINEVKSMFSETDLKLFLDFVKSKDLNTGLVFEFLSLTGLRKFEFYKLSFDSNNPRIIGNSNLFSCVYDDYILVNGKRTKFYIPKLRQIPIDIIPNLRNCINQLKQFIDKKGNVTKIPYVTLYDKLERLISLYNKENNNQIIKVTVHSFRRYAFNYWENVLKFDSKIINLIGGNDKMIRDKEYIEILDYQGIIKYLSDSSPNQKQ